MIMLGQHSPAQSRKCHKEKRRKEVSQGKARREEQSVAEQGGSRQVVWMCHGMWFCNSVSSLCP